MPRPTDRHRQPATRSRLAARLAALTLIVAFAATVGAQTVPTGVQEYFILGWEQHLWDMMDMVQNGEGGTQFANGMNSVVTATASASNQVIYYDHWEDGYDAALDDFPDVTLSLQSSTLVIGDGDPSNGDVCNFNTNITCPSTDILAVGDYVNFNSDGGLGTPACAVFATTPEFCSVPLSPRVQTDIRFDGGDLLLTSGGPLSLIHNQWPLTQYIGGATEILSRQAVEAARSYSVPIGVDLYAVNTVTEPFQYVELELVAFEDTSITVDSPGAGSVSFTLARGEHWSSMGFVDDTSFPALALTINAGTKVSTSAAITGMIFTGGDGTWATRHYALLPDILHGTDYITTAPGDQVAVGPETPLNKPDNVYILNPDQLSSIDVAITDSSGNYSVTIPPNSMRSMQDLSPGRDIADNSTVRLTSDRRFWGITAYFWDSSANDWGHSWLSEKFLTLAYTVGHAPANSDIINNPGVYTNPVFVAATTNNTLVYFDLNNDGIYDQVDTTGDGILDAPSNPDNSYEVDVPSALRVFDPGDDAMTGTRIIANKPIAVSWGQDSDLATGGGVGLDTGYTVYPVDQAFLDPALTIEKTTDTTTVPLNPVVVPDDLIVTYTLTVNSYDFGPLTSAKIYDLLPLGIAGTDYVTGSTLITYPDLTQDTAEPTATTQPSGRILLEWPLTSDPPWASGDPEFSFGTDEVLTVQYQVAIPIPGDGLPRRLLNQGRAQAELGDSIFIPTDIAAVVQTDADLVKSVDSTDPGPGDVLTFTLVVSNNGPTNPETNIIVSDSIPADTTYCDATTHPGVCSNPTGTSPFTSGTFYPGQNAIEWIAGSLGAGGSATLTFQVIVNPTTPTGTLIPNRGGYESDLTPYFLSNEVVPIVIGPSLDAVKSILGDPVAVHPYEAVTFEILIDNSGSAAADNVLIVDPFPTNSTYVPGSMEWSLNSGPFSSLSDTDDGDEGDGAEGILNASDLEYRLASLGASENLRFRFRMQVDAGTAGLFVSNQAIFASDETPSTDTNLVQVPVVGNATINGHVFVDSNGNGVQDAGEPDMPNVDVEVSSVASLSYGCSPSVAIPDNAYDGSQGSMTCCTINVPAGDFGASPSITDLNLDFSADHTYVGDLTIKIFGPGGQTLAALNRPGSTAADDGTDTPYGSGTNWTGATVTFDDDGGGPSAETMGSAGGDVCSGDGICNYLPAPDTAGGLTNLAGYDGTDPRGNWSVCIADGAGGDTGTFNSANLTIVTDEATTSTQIVTTDANGDYTAVVTGTAAGLDVDETDPDFLPGGELTTANDPQTVTTIPGGTVTAPDVGYQQPALIFTKTSDAVNNEVSPAQTVTYTLEITNNTGATQTSIVVTDAVPTGTTYVAGSSQVMSQQTATSRVAANNDDAEEDMSDGDMSRGSTDLEMVFDGTTEQMVGMRFLAVAVPNSATIASAEIEFRADESDTGTTNVTFLGQNADTTATFSDTDFDISNRPQTSASVDWTNIPAWTTNSFYQTPDLATVVQEIVDRTGWSTGNSMVFLVEAGTGCTSSACNRVADSYNGSNANAPLLTINYEVSASAGSPPNLLTGSEGYTLPAGQTMTLTFQVTVDDPLGAGITQIQNTATLSTSQQPGPFTAEVTDDVVRAGVVVEYDNAGFDLAGAVVTYNHVIENTGEGDDSYAVSTTGTTGWRVDLIDPSSGAIIATDATGDGVWDGGAAPNTGTLVPGETIEYQLRVTIPGGAAAGDSASTALIATSERNTGVSGVATDETVVVGTLDPIIFLPDNSGVIDSGGQVVYTHRIINNTGANETFRLEAAREDPSSTWTATYYWDTNGDGSYTDGIDIAITNTALLADGEWQQIFVVVEDPAGSADFTTDVVHLTAFALSDPTDATFDTASDTTTVTPPEVLDLSGGGTRNVTGGTTAVFPGTLRNLTGASDVINFQITESWFWGFDSLNHPTQLWIDSDGDGSADLRVAEDTTGDGTWDYIAPGYGLDAVAGPEVTVAADSSLTYELRRPVDASQQSSRDPVTLTVLSTNSTDQDSVTATNFLAAATRATLSSFAASAINGQVVVEWSTAVEIGTVGFDLLRRRTDSGQFERVNSALIRGVTGRLQGGAYQFVDRGAAPGTTVDYALAERDVWGTGRRFGPWTVTIQEQPATMKHTEVLATGLARTPHRSAIQRELPAAAIQKSAGGPRSGMIKILVQENGLVWLPTDSLATEMGVNADTVATWIASGNLWIGTTSTVGESFSGIFSDGFESGGTSMWAAGAKEPETPEAVAWIAGEGNNGLFFYGEAIDSIYTLDNVYWLGIGPGETMAGRSGGAETPRFGEAFVETVHIEEENWPLTSVMTDPEIDFWMWAFFYTDTSTPSASETFTLNTPDVDSGDTTATLTVHLQGSSLSEVQPNHQVQVELNGTQLGGTWSWNGHDAYSLVLDFPQSLLASGDNTVEITALLASGDSWDEFYLDGFDLTYRRLYQALGDRLLGRGNGSAVVTVGGFSSSDIVVFDTTDPQHPVILDPVHVSSDEGSYSATFAGGGPDFAFLATTPAATLPPSGLVVDLASDLSNPENTGRYVIIAGSGLEGAAGDLAAYRTQQGLSSVVARIADIYDEFNDGIKSPWAIRDFLEYASGNWLEPPDYVFLAGDGSLDHKGFWLDGEDLIPAPMAVTGDGLVPSDNLLVDWLGGDGVPDVAIGRLPAQTEAELAAYSEKIEIFEASAGPWKRHTLWLVDDDDIGGDFGDDSETLIARLPSGFTTDRVSLDDLSADEAWQRTIDLMSKGSMLVNFLGHGGFDRLADEGLLVTEYAAAMTNVERTPYLAALTCIVGRFDVPDFPTLAEALVLNGDGGAIALWSPSAYSMNEDARILGGHHLEAITGGDTTIGDAVRDALIAYLAEGEGDPALPQKLVLIGDPATRVSW